MPAALTLRLVKAHGRTDIFCESEQSYGLAHIPILGEVWRTINALFNCLLAKFNSE